MICRERIVWSPNVSYHSVPMQIQGLARAYRTKTDEELLQLAMSSEQLTPEAHAILTSELATRGIDLNEHLKERENAGSALIERRAPRSIPFFRDSHTVGDFVTETVRVYHGQFWLFIKLIAPAVVVGYIAIVTARNEVREILRQLPRGIEVLGHHA